jgi:guanylate kinase
MGKLIIISGPSCVGKGPLVKTLELYLKALGKKLVRHVLYNTRPLKKNEVHKQTYYYAFMWDKVNGKWSNEKDVSYNRDDAVDKLKDIAAKANKRGQHFETFEIGKKDVKDKDLQGLNYSVLEKQLKKYDIVLLEIYQDKANDVVAFCKKKEFDVKRIFVSPLSEEDYNYSGCSKDKKKRGRDRAIAVKATMLDKLRSRARDDEADILKRADRAVDEIRKAGILLEEGKIDAILINHFGEGVKEWDALQKRAGSKSECYKYREKDFTSTGEIDKMFKRFLYLISP